MCAIKLHRVISNFGSSRKTVKQGQILCSEDPILGKSGAKNKGKFRTSLKVDRGDFPVGRIARFLNVGIFPGGYCPEFHQICLCTVTSQHLSSLSMTVTGQQAFVQDMRRGACVYDIHIMLSVRKGAYCTLVFAHVTNSVHPDVRELTHVTNLGI